VAIRRSPTGVRRCRALLRSICRPLWLDWGAGPFLYTLTVVDVPLAGSAVPDCAINAPSPARRLHRPHEGLPFRILGLDSESGSEFLNRPLVEYCAAQRVTLTRLYTRGRPYRKE